MSGYQSPFDKACGPIIEQLVQDFGPTHGADLVEDYATGFLAINTCGGGVHPNDIDRLFSHLGHSADNSADRLGMPDASEALIADEGLTNELLLAFKGVWPQGRDTVLA